eukprot:3156024-Rhodomonas_salina.1
MLDRSGIRIHSSARDVGVFPGFRVRYHRPVIQDRCRKKCSSTSVASLDSFCVCSSTAKLLQAQLTSCSAQTPEPSRPFSEVPEQRGRVPDRVGFSPRNSTEEFLTTYELLPEYSDYGLDPWFPTGAAPRWRRSCRPSRFALPGKKDSVSTGQSAPGTARTPASSTPTHSKPGPMAAVSSV